MINKWLELAKWAPSGGNTQAWRVRGQENSSSIKIHLDISPHIYENDSPFSAGGWAHLYSLGGFSYILSKIASAYGFELEKTSTNDGKKPIEVTFQLQFKKKGEYSYEKERECIQFFKARQTNRNPYEKTLLKTEHFELIKNIALQYPRLELKSYIENKNQIANKFREIESIRWTNFHFVNGLFQELSLNDESSEMGITASTLGCPLPVIQFLRFWKQNRWFDLLAKIVLKQPLVKGTFSDLISNSGGLFFIQAKETSILSSYELGQFFTHVWTELNNQGVEFQPVGTPLIAFCYHHGLAQMFSKQEIQGITNSVGVLNKSENLDLNLSTMGFRVGYSQTKANPSKRKTVEWTNLNETEIEKKVS